MYSLIEVTPPWGVKYEGSPSTFCSSGGIPLKVTVQPFLPYAYRARQFIFFSVCAVNLRVILSPRKVYYAVNGTVL